MSRKLLPLWILALMIVLVPCGRAQEEAKAKDEVELSLIQEIRGGTWKQVRVEKLIRRFIARGNRHAARWWIQQANRAAADGLLPSDSPKKLRILAKTEGLKPTEPQLRAMPSRALKYLKKLQSLKCYSAIPTGVQFTRRCLELYPDSKMEKTVDEIEASLEKADRKSEKKITKGLKKNLDRLRDALAKARDELLDDMVDQYRRFPCPPGARAIRALILARGEKEVSAAWRQTWNEVSRIEHQVEPKLKLKVWIANGGKIYAYRNGERLMANHGRSYFGERKQGVTFDVVAGDVLQFEVKKLYAKRGDRKMFVVAAAATLDGKELRSSQWSLNANVRPKSIDPLPNPRCRCIRFSSGKLPEDLSDEVLEMAREIGEGLLIPTPDEMLHQAIGMHAKIRAAESAFSGWKKAPTWIGGEGEKICVLLRVPR